jgi:RNA polymerase sigma-70 factor (ECF subfamily)
MHLSRKGHLATDALRPRLRLVAPQAAPGTPLAAPALDDSALLAGLEERDPATASAFYERVRPIVDRTLLRLLGARDNDYEDVAQLALFELVDTLGRFRGECPLDAWISIVTARVVYRHIRRRKLERRLFAQVPLDEVSGSLRSASPKFASRQAVARVRTHLENVEERRAWTFLLHDVYGYDLKEISQIMGVTLSAAQSRLVRGRREIHERIRKDPELAHFLDDLNESEEAP